MPTSSSSTTASVKTGSSSAQSSHDSGPSSVPFRASSAVKTKPRKSPTTASSAGPSSNYTTWLLLDTDDNAAPFLRTLHEAALPGSSSPAARSSEKLTESTNLASSSRSNPQPNDVDREEKKRMSLQQGSTGKRGFMSKLRNVGGSVSGVNHFAAPPTMNGMSSSGSWAMVDSPTATLKEESGRKVHVAFTRAASESSIKGAHGLIIRSAPTLLSAETEGAALSEQVHGTKMDVAGLQGLVELVRPDAVYVGSARSFGGAEELKSLLSGLISTPSTVKHVLVEPATVRQLTPAQATSLFDLASTTTLSLPLRCGALLKTTPEETLVGLELLHELSNEITTTNGPKEENGDASEADTSFDVSMSNIPTGLSQEGLDEVERVKQEVERLKGELKGRDRRIAELEVASQTARIPAPPTPMKEPALPPALPAPTSPLPQTPEPVIAPSTPAQAKLGSAAIIASPPSPSQSRGTSKVIASLTAELNEARTLLTATQSALVTVRTQSAQHQAAAEEMRSTLSRARLENDSSITILARKDRQIVDALERARKAEAEAKELGRAGREWGTRVREVEEELGKERVRCARAEQAYDALSSEWKTARERLRTEVDELRKQHEEKVKELSEEYKKVLGFRDRLQEEWSGYGSAEGGADGPKSLVKAIEGVNSNMQAYVEREIAPLLAQLKRVEEREDREVTSKLKTLTDELTRIKTLMRRGDVVSPSQVPPSTL